MYGDLISVVVPVYNVENHIEKCVNSPMNQTYKNIEIIEKAWAYHRYRFNRSIASGLLESDMVSEYPDLYKECIKNIMMPLKMERIFKAKVGWILYFINPSLVAKRSLRIHKKLSAKFSGGQLTFCKISMCRYTPIAMQVVGGCV